MTADRSPGPSRGADADPLEGEGRGKHAEEFLALLPGEEEEGFGRVVDAVRWGEERLRHAGVRGARLQATLLVGQALGMDRAQVLANLREPVEAAGDARVRELIGRRAAHEPLQYLRGKAPFLDFDVEVQPGVFIPRPETELVVERALELWRPGEPWRRDVGSRWAVDVGTGSGIIAIALALARPWGRVCAIDVSSGALAVARRNARRLGVLDRIVFVRGDLLAPLGARGTSSGDSPPGAAGSLPPGVIRRAVGIVVSNPPYAPEDSPDVHHEVREHEPREAWAAGPTGLEVYRRLIPQAAALLLPGRPLVLELGYEQERAVPGLMAGDGRWGEPDVRPDFQGIPRVLTTRRSAGFQTVSSASGEF